MRLENPFNEDRKELIVIKKYFTKGFLTDISQPGNGGMRPKAGWLYKPCHGILVDLSGFSLLLSFPCLYYIILHAI